MSEGKNIGGLVRVRRRTIWDCCALVIAVIVIIGIATSTVIWRTDGSIETVAVKIR